jgi:3-hydroxybutyrate dehydrogenase
MLKGRNALITGSTSGIGLGIAKAMAAQGAGIMLNGFGDPDEIRHLRQSIADEHGVEVDYSSADMSRPEEIRDLARQANERFGAVDILVNNAGIQLVSPIEEFPDDMWNAIIAVNLSSAFHTIKHMLGTMKSRRWGRVINIASAHALVASPFKSAYVSAKHGMLGLTRTVALECAEHGVTVNAICPGYVRTPLVEKQIPDSARTHGISEDSVVRDVMLAPQPTRRFVAVEEVAGLALYLCSDVAASITGTALSVDGGWTAQ